METRQLEITQNAFNLNKASELERINAEGKALKSIVDKLKIESVQLQEAINEKRSRQVILQKRISDGVEAVEKLEEKEGAYASSPVYVSMGKKKEAIELDIEKLKASNSGAAEAMRLVISAIDTKIADCESAIAQIKQREAGLQRIEELGAEEKKLSAEFERLEGELYLTEQFVRVKVALLESRVNGMFEITKWKLFEVLVNGGISEVCEATVDGVPYSSGLNNGMRIEAGMDCIKTLQRFYNFYCPVWVDQAESFCHLPEMECQVIRLVVSEKDKVLRIEAAKEAVAV